MFVEPAHSAETGNEELEWHVGGAAADENEGHEIGADDGQEKIRCRHVAGRDRPRGARHVMEIVAEPAKTQIVQLAAVRCVLYNVVPDRHQKEREHGESEADFRSPDKCQSGSFTQPHRRQEDKRLIEENPRKSGGIGEPFLPAYLESAQHAISIAAFETKADRVKHDHVPRPDDDGDGERDPERHCSGNKSHRRVQPSAALCAGRVAKTASHQGALTPNQDESSRK